MLLKTAASDPIAAQRVQVGDESEGKKTKSAYQPVWISQINAFHVNFI